MPVTTSSLSETALGMMKVRRAESVFAIAEGEFERRPPGAARLCRAKQSVSKDLKVASFLRRMKCVAYR